MCKQAAGEVTWRQRPVGRDVVTRGETVVAWTRLDQVGNGRWQELLGSGYILEADEI